MVINWILVIFMSLSANGAYLLGDAMGVVDMFAFGVLFHIIDRCLVNEREDYELL